MKLYTFQLSETGKAEMSGIQHSEMFSSKKKAKQAAKDWFHMHNFDFKYAFIVQVKFSVDKKIKLKKQIEV